MVNVFALEEAMFRLGQLWSMAWIARGKVDPARYGFTNRPHQLSIDVNNGDKATTLTVEFGGQCLSRGPYGLVELDDERRVFECPVRIYGVYRRGGWSVPSTVG